MTGLNVEGIKEDEPLDPNVERVRSNLVRFVVINLGLLFLILMAVVGALVYKARTGSGPEPVQISGDVSAPAGGQLIRDILLPVGAKVMSQSLSGRRITIDAELIDGKRIIYVYDIAECRIVGQFWIRNR